MNSNLQSELALLKLNSDRIVMPPVTRRQLRLSQQTTAAPFPSSNMSQRRGARQASARASLRSSGRYATRGAARAAPESTEIDEAPSDSDEATADEEDASSSDESEEDEDETTQRAAAERNYRVSKAVRHLTLVLAPEPVEEYALDAGHPLPHSIARRSDESAEFNRIVDLLTRLSCTSETVRAQLLESTPLQLNGPRWGDVILRKFSRSFFTIRNRFIDWTKGAYQHNADVVDTGNALRNWMAGLAYVIPDRFQHMSDNAQVGFVDCILQALDFVIRADADIRNMRATPDYASQPPVQNNLYYNVIANGRGDAFGMHLLYPLRVVIRNHGQVELVRKLWNIIRQRHLLPDADSSQLKPSAQFIELLSQLNIYVNSRT